MGLLLLLTSREIPSRVGQRAEGEERVRNRGREVAALGLEMKEVAEMMGTDPGAMVAQPR